MRRAFVLFLILICLFAVTPLTSAEEPEAEWTVDIAKQLLAEGWEESLFDGSTRVIGYALHFVELKKEAWALLSLGLEFDTNERGPGLWLLEEKNFVFDLLFDSEFHFKPNFQAELGSSKEKGKYESWLLTMEGKPLTVHVSSTQIPSPPQGHRAEKLEVKILPIYVQQQTGQIESEISIIYETLSGSAIDVHTIARVGGAPKRPIAIASRQVQVGNKTEYQYFALYLAGIVIPAELLPTEKPYLQVGSIAGMQLFMEEAPVKRPGEVGLGASFHDGGRGIRAEASLPLGERHGIYGSVETLPYFIYIVGAEAGLNEDLYLVTELNGSTEVALFVGLRDELRVGEKTKVAVTVLPVCFTAASPPQTVEFNWRVRLEQDFDIWGVWYQVENIRVQERTQHRAGLTALKNKPVVACLSWSWDEAHGNTVTVGMRFKF